MTRRTNGIESRAIRFIATPRPTQKTTPTIVQEAIELGLLRERECDRDRRMRLLALSEDCVARVERFLDFTCRRFRTVGA